MQSITRTPPVHKATDPRSRRAADGVSRRFTRPAASGLPVPSSANFYTDSGANAPTRNPNVMTRPSPVKSRIKHIRRIAAYWPRACWRNRPRDGPGDTPASGPTTRPLQRRVRGSCPRVRHDSRHPTGAEMLTRAAERYESRVCRIPVPRTRRYCTGISQMSSTWAFRAKSAGAMKPRGS